MCDVFYRLAPSQSAISGFLSGASQIASIHGLAAFRKDLVSRHVAVIFAVGGSHPARAAKAATSTIIF
jgi:hypothetical protein